MVERFNRTLIKMIWNVFIADAHDEWDLNLSCLTSAYRSTCHESTGLTSNLLMFGRKLRRLFIIQWHPMAKKFLHMGNLWKKSGLTFIMLMKFAGHLKQAAQRQYDVYNATMLIHKYTTGDVVWLFNEKLGNKCPKFKQAYVGPCIVTETFSDLVFKI